MSEISNKEFVVPQRPDFSNPSERPPVTHSQRKEGRYRAQKKNPLSRTIRPELALLGAAAATVVGGQMILKGLNREVFSDSKSAIVESVSADVDSPSDAIKLGAHPQKYEQTTPKIVNFEKRQETPQQILDKVISTVPINLKDEAGVSIPLVARIMQEQGMTSKKALAFAFANSEWEAGLDVAKSEFNGEEQAKKLGYKGKIWGRGLAQITHEDMYDEVSKWIKKRYPEKYGDLDLTKTPDRVLEPELSAMSLVAFMDIKKIPERVEQGDLHGGRVIWGGEFDSDDELRVRADKYVTQRYNSYYQLLNR